ncbi:gastrin/cholecystokinin type B receptor-like [Lytechinus variegatus]|uniref:gastrin/cholecystokinin type B receptor-like n=1 Tax=Lytechinus variegatus TaxID=7654 RepID=UPI001BB287A9|nr:gastrin/cholecystokinin type B receptor-like [Lytechinus variegatus]
MDSDLKIMMLINESEGNAFNHDTTVDDETEEMQDGFGNTIANLTYYMAIVVFGCPGNAVIVQAYAWKKRKTSTDIFIMAQGMVDFIACVFTPTTLIRSTFRSLITVNVCRFASLVGNATALASLLMTAVISIDRYTAVCRPFRRRVTTTWVSISVAIACVVISIAITIPTDISMDVGYVNETRVKFCYLRRSGLTRVASFVGILLFGASFLTNTVSYFKIYHFLRKRAKIHADLVSKEIRVATISRNPESSCSSDSSSKPNTRHSPAVAIESDDMHSNHDNASSVVAYKKNGSTVQSHSAGPSNPITLRMSPTREKPSNIESAVTNMPQSYRKTLSMHSNLTGSGNRPRHVPVPESLYPSEPKLFRKKEEHDYGRRTTRMLLIVTIYLFATWTPLMVIGSLRPSILLGIDPRLFTFVQILSSLRLTNHVVNFFVYYLVSKSFRKDVRQSFKRYRCRGAN